jgi:hypothetical protein
MTTRTREEVLTFRSSFVLPGWEETLPPGDYTVTTDEELLDTSFPANRRLSTTVALSKGAVTRHISVDPIELAAAHARDQATASSPPG